MSGPAAAAFFAILMRDTIVTKGHVRHIETFAVANTHFRRVLHAAGHSRLVVMSLNPARRSVPMSSTVGMRVPLSREASQSVHQDSQQPGRPAGDRGDHFRRYSGECHAALLIRAVRRRGRGVHARHRMADRVRPRPEGRARGIDLCQPLGRVGEGQGAGAASESSQDRDRRAYVQGVSRAADLSPLADTCPQRLLWASTGTKDPHTSDTFYVEARAATDTINTMPEKTLFAFADHGKVTAQLSVDGGDAEIVLDEFARTDVDGAGLAATLQREGTQPFDTSWNDLMECIAAKSGVLKKAAHAQRQWR
jgi:hypothetical protein